MKGLKKINIGLLLTIITVVLVVAYCIHVENARKAAKEDIINACNTYIEATDKFAYLPEEYQVIGIKKSDVNLDDYDNRLEKTLKQYTVNDGVANIEKTVISQIVETQLMDSDGVVVDFDRKIVNFNSFQFSGNQVTVTFNSKIVVKKKYMSVDPETGEQTEKVGEIRHNAQDESIVLEKSGNEWKIVYSNLNYIGGGSSNNNM